MTLCSLVSGCSFGFADWDTCALNLHTGSKGVFCFVSPQSPWPRALWSLHFTRPLAPWATVVLQFLWQYPLQFASYLSSHFSPIFLVFLSLLDPWDLLASILFCSYFCFAVYKFLFVFRPQFSYNGQTLHQTWAMFFT